MYFIIYESWKASYAKNAFCMGSAHHFQAQNCSSKRPEAQQSEAACVSCHIRSNMAASLCSEIQRHDEIFLLKILGQVLKHTSRLTSEDTCKMQNKT